MFNIIVTVLGILILAGIGWLGQLGQGHKLARYIVLGWMILCGLVLSLAGGLIKVAFYLNPEALPPNIETLAYVVLLMGIAVVPCLFPQVRRGLTHWFKGLDVDNPAHTWALYIFTCAFIGTIAMLTVLYEPEAIIIGLKSVPLLESGLINVCSFMLMAFVALGVGQPGRSVSVIAVQLGLQPVDKYLVFKLIGLALLLAVGIQFLENGLMQWVSPEVRNTLQQIAEAMKIAGGPAVLIPTALAVSLCAGIGEEVLFRGLLQPVFGLVASALLFTLIHMHYGPTVLLLELLLVGALLGWIRQRYNTTAAIIVHAAFDFFALTSSLLHS